MSNLLREEVTMKDISDRRSFGVQWSPTYGLKFQLINPKGTTNLQFHSSRAGYDTVEAPSRFGLNSPPQSYDDFLRVAAQYMEELDRTIEHARKHTVVHKIDGGTRSVDQDTPPQRFLRLF
jgi:hypothetical protein